MRASKTAPDTLAVSGGDQAGRRRRDVTTIESRNSGASARSDADLALRALLARPHKARDATVHLPLVARQLRWRARNGSGDPNRDELILRGLIEGVIQSHNRRAGDTLTAYLGNPNLYDLAETVRELVEEGRALPAGPGPRLGASPGSASHAPEDVAARRVKWVATKPRVTKTMRFGDLVSAPAGRGGTASDHLYNLLPLTRNHAMSALAPARGAPRSEEARAQAWKDKVHEVYSGHVNGVIELPPAQARNFGWAVSLREQVPQDDEGGARTRRPRRARPGKSFDDLLKDVAEGRSGGGGGGGAGLDEGDEAPEVARMQSVLGGLRAIQYIASKLDQGGDVDRLAVLRAAAANVTKLAERAVGAAAGSAEAQRADHVTATRNSIVWGAVQQAALDRAKPGRAAQVRDAAAGMARSAGGTPEPRSAWRLLEADVV